MNYCVLTLARLCNNDLNNLIENLNTYFVQNNKNVDLLVFIEKKSTDCVQNTIKYLGGKLIFHTIDNLDEIVKYKEEVPQKVFGFGVNYRSMCRFFSGELFKILKTYNYTHYLRLDTDSTFTEPVRDLFSEFVGLNMSYGYMCILSEPPEVTTSIVEYTKEYVKNNPDIQNYILRDHYSQLNFCYYNNFEMVKISDFTTDNHINLYHHLDNKNGFMKYRWGDALFRYIYVNLFIPQDKIHYFANVGYHHKFQLKNTPFKFVDWNISDFRIHNTSE